MKKKTSQPVFRLTPKWQPRFNFTAKDVVDLFLNVNRLWFSEKENAMYKKRARIRRVLMAYLTRGEDIAQKKEEIYALNKFQSEWLEHDAVFGRVT